MGDTPGLSSSLGPGMTQGVHRAPSLSAQGRISPVNPPPPPQARPASARHAPPTQTRPPRSPEVVPHQTIVLSNTILPPSSLPDWFSWTAKQRLLQLAQSSPPITDLGSASWFRLRPPRWVLGVVGTAKIERTFVGGGDVQRKGPTSTFGAMQILWWITCRRYLREAVKKPLKMLWMYLS